MNRADLYARLATIAASVFECPPELFREETIAGDIPRWDSFNHVKLLVTIEDELGLRFGNSDLVDPKNWGEFVDMIAGRVGA